MTHYGKLSTLVLKDALVHQTFCDESGCILSFDALI